MVADYFCLSDCYAELLKFLELYVYSAIDVSNCLSLLRLAHKFDHEDMKEACLEFIVANQSKVLAQKEWNELSLDLRVKVLHECDQKRATE